MSLPSDQCLEVTRVATNASCPVTFNTTLSLQFDVSSHTTRNSLKWRQAVESGDSLNPSTGSVPVNGSGTISLQDIALDDGVIIEIYDTDTDEVLLRFNLRHR